MIPCSMIILCLYVGCLQHRHLASQVDNTTCDSLKSNLQWQRQGATESHFDDIATVIYDGITAYEHPDILSVCEVEDGLAQLSCAHS